MSAAFKPSEGPASPVPSQSPSSTSGTGLPGAGLQAAAPRVLWSEAAELAEARERSQWHELMSRRNMDQNETLQVTL